MDDPTPLHSDIGQYAIVPLWLVQSDVSATALRVFALLAARYANRVTQECWPSQQRIADDLGLHRNTVKQAISELVDRGVLTRRHRAGQGLQTSNHYTLRFVEPAHFRRTAGCPPLDTPVSTHRTPQCPPVGHQDVHEPESGEPESVNQREAARAPLRPSSLIDSALQWHKRHAAHVQELCDWVCFPQELASQFATRAKLADAEILAWARQVRSEWETAGKVPTGSMYDFWNARWSERCAGTSDKAVVYAGLAASRKAREERERLAAEKEERRRVRVRAELAEFERMRQEVWDEQQRAQSERAD